MQRDIVIAGHDDLRLGQLIEKCTRFDELARAGALRQISGDGYQIRIDAFDRLDQRRNDLSVDAAEMYIGKMDD